MKVTRTKLCLEKMLKLTKSFNKELTVIQSFVNETNDELRNRTKAKLPRDFHEELEWIEVRRYMHKFLIHFFSRHTKMFIICNIKRSDC